MHQESRASGSRLLIVTQVVDERDPDLGFFCGWIREFAKRYESVGIICLFEGEYHLPQNVHVHSLGKERGATNALIYAARFLRLVWRQRGTYDTVLVHMNPEYLILAGPLWRLWGKRVALWYVHRSANIRLRIGALFAHRIFSASPESFRLRMKTVRIIGHGIDIEKFAISAREAHSDVRVATIGRISPSKHITEMLAGIAEVRRRNIPVRFTIVGAPATEHDRTYEKTVTAAIERLHLQDVVEMVGGVVYAEVPRALQDVDVMLNLSTTGSIDKAVLEALASGVPVVTSNEAFARVPVVHYIFTNDPGSIAEGIERARTADPMKLRSYVAERHSLPHLVDAIVHELSI